MALLVSSVVALFADRAIRIKAAGVEKANTAGAELGYAREAREARDTRDARRELEVEAEENRRKQRGSIRTIEHR